MFRIISRTPEEKADLEGSWRRTDEEFFAAGACHVLAGVFLECYPQAGFHALLIRPAAGFRCSHVVVSDGARVFDVHGWNALPEFLQRYEASCRALYPGWTCTTVRVDDPLGWEFARAYEHRHPSEYFADPIPRARAFLRKCATPAAIWAPLAIQDLEMPPAAIRNLESGI